MPKYVYHCKCCTYEFEIRHSIRDRLYDCPECDIAESLIRVPQLTQKQVKEEKPIKTGQLVKEYIESNREILKEERQNIEDYEP